MRNCRDILLGAALAGTLSIPVHAQTNPERGRQVVLGAASAIAPRSACHTCHGLHGAGDSSGAFPRLTGQSAWYLYKQLKDYASGERQNDIMSPIAKSLTDRQMQDVADYYARQSADPIAAASRVDPLLLQRGGSISAMGLHDRSVAACVNCHGPAGTGLPPSFPYLAGQYAPYIELQFQFWKDGARRNSPVGVMEHIAQQLTEDEIRSLAAYFASLQPPAPQRQATTQR